MRFTTIALACLAALALGALAASDSLAKKGGGGGKPGGNDNPTGTVYYALGAQPQLHAMDADGSGKTVLPTGVRGEPSHGLLGGHRWFLYVDTVAGTYPDGSARQEVFAIREDGTGVVQLTNDALVEPRGPARWAADGDGNDDAVASWNAMRWQGTTRVESGIYAAALAFDGNGGVNGLAEAPGAVVVGAVWHLADDVPEVGGFDWKPDATALVYRRSDSSGASDGLYVHDVSAGSASQITTDGMGPVWSRDGARIAFHAGGIATVDPDGTNRQTIVAAKSKGGSIETLHSAQWSPASTHLVYCRYYRKTTGQSTKDVYRVKAGGSGKTNLTGDTDAFATPVAWR